MTVSDYASLAMEEAPLWPSQLKTSLDTAMHARQDIPAENDHFPVVVYAPSDSAPAWENADLCEYLASHGYVVIAGPSMGADSPDMTDDVAGINAQARDISFLMSYAATLPDTDMSDVAVVSWSWGGIASLFAAARDPRIKALAQMDGSLRYYPGLVRQAGDIDAARMHIPLMFFTAEYPNLLEDLEQDHDSSQADRIGPNVLNAWTHGDLYTINMIGMSHGQFGAMAQRRKSDAKFAEDQIADFSRADANVGYGWVARYTLRFLDANLKHSREAAAFLRKTPAENGVPAHFMGTRFRAAQ